MVVSPLVEALDLGYVGEDVEFVVVGKGGLVDACDGEFSGSKSVGNDIDDE